MTVKKEYYSGGPMQYFREGYETKKKMMLGGIVLDEPEFDLGDPQKKAAKKNSKAARKGRRKAGRNNNSNCTKNAGCGSRSSNRSMSKKLKKVR